VHIFWAGLGYRFDKLYGIRAAVNITHAFSHDTVPLL
jgi:hypothetical protein